MINDQLQTVCPSLPSSTHANALLSGQPKALVSVVGDLMLRSGLIMVGLYVYDPEQGKIVQKSIAASLAVEFAVLVMTEAARASRSV